MAKEEEGSEGSGKGKSNQKLVIIIGVLAALLVLVIGGAAGAIMTMKKDAHSADTAGGDEGGDEEHEEGGSDGHGGGPSSLIPLEPFIVNLQVKGSYVKATLQLKFSPKNLPKNLESDLPKIRDAVITTLSTKSATEILSGEGKEALREELKTSINTALGGEKVTQVYFTEFIVQ